MELREMTQRELDERQGLVPRWPDGKPAMIAGGAVLLGDGLASPYEFNIDPSGAWLTIRHAHLDMTTHRVVHDPDEEYKLGNPFYRRSTAEAFARGIGEPRTLAEWIALGFVSL